MVTWMKSKRTGDLLLLANGLALVILLNLSSAFYFFRIDLTEEKRYTIQPQTRTILESLEEVVFVEVFLEGEDLNPEFRRFQKSIRETLEEFRIYSGNKLQYTFTDPLQAINEKARNEFIAELNSKGVSPRNVVETRKFETIQFSMPREQSHTFAIDITQFVNCVGNLKLNPFHRGVDVLCPASF